MKTDKLGDNEVTPIGVTRTQTKRRSKKPPTRQLLIDVGEHLFGQQGISGISLRELAAYAGLSSNNAVQYHFDNKEGLISAILEDRVEKMAVYREQLYEELHRLNQDKARVYLMLMWLPRMSLKGSDGTHTFCRFLLQLCLQPQMSDYPLMRYYDEKLVRKQKPDENNDVILETIKGLKSQFPQLSDELFERRLSVLNQAHLTSVVTSDNARRLNTPNVPEYDMDFIIDFAIGALSAPEKT